MLGKCGKHARVSDSENPLPPLPELRAQLDELDRQVLELLARRMEIVSGVARLKRAENKEIRDSNREQQLLASRRALAVKLGLDPESVESIYRQILISSRDHQAAMNRGPGPEGPKRSVLVVGGAGAMGRVLSQLFQDLGHTVQSLDLDSQQSAKELVPAADVVVISVPIAVTESVIRELGPLVRPDALLMDVTSIKSAPLQAMLDASRASVVGAHPMFGPGSASLNGQRVVLCRGRGDGWFEWLAASLRARGLVITEASAEEHDRAMSLVQVLTHFQTQVFGLALARTGIPLESSRRFTSPAYLMELYVAARHFAQASELYGPIEMRNPATAEVTAQFQRAAREIAEILERHDQQRFDAVFQEVRAFFGDFAQEATEESRFLIDRLVERSMT
jgi:chorismate mutase/prephenate dehydrogenase